MSGETAIEWTDATWNPTTGCDRVSSGCDRCYAMTLAKRLKGMGSAAYQLDGDPTTSGPGFLAHEWPRALDWPLHKKKPLRIFVNSMSDLFHASISDEYIAQVFAVMALAPQHTFQILTKRHARMRSLLASDDFRANVTNALVYRGVHDGSDDQHLAEAQPDWYPLRNVWLGVSVEDQHWAKIRIPALLDTPAAVRFLSCEPLLGPVNLRNVRTVLGRDALTDLGVPGTTAIDWVIAGGESGPGARPMHPDWAHALRDQCVATGVPFLFKQWGEWRPTRAADPLDRTPVVTLDGRTLRRIGKKAAGRELDGRTWDEYPAGVA